MKKDDTVFLKHILDAIMSVSCKAGLRTSPYNMRSFNENYFKEAHRKSVCRQSSGRCGRGEEIEKVLERVLEEVR